MRSLGLALPLLASACLDAHAAGPARYDLQGGQAVESTVTAYLAADDNAVDLDGDKIGAKKAELVLVDIQDPTLRQSLEDLVSAGNAYVSKDPRGQIRVQIGCIDGMNVVNDDSQFTIGNEAALLASGKDRPVTVVMKFEDHGAGWGGACSSLPDGLAVK